MDKTAICLAIFGFLVLMIPQWSQAQLPAACVSNPLKFGIVVPGETKTIHYSDVANALCLRENIPNTPNTYTVFFTLPTHLTNGTDMLPISFGNGSAFMYHGSLILVPYQVIINPNLSITTLTPARVYIQFNMGGTIHVPPVISPGFYTGTITINIVHH